VKEVVTSLNRLQNKVIDESSADVGLCAYEDHASTDVLDMLDLVAHGYHDQNKYACRGHSGDGGGRDPRHRSLGPSEFEACLEGCFSVCIVFGVP
jgi:hypothetical protein